MIHKTIVLEKWSEARYFAPAQRRDYPNAYNGNMPTQKSIPFNPFLALALLALLFDLRDSLLNEVAVLLFLDSSLISMCKR
jgi:hypothetical protein